MFRLRWGGRTLVLLPFVLSVFSRFKIDVKLEIPHQNLIKINAIDHRKMNLAINHFPSDLTFLISNHLLFQMLWQIPVIILLAT